MTGPLLRTLMAGLASAGLPLAAMAAEETAGKPEPASLEELTKIAENSTFIWMEEPESEAPDEAQDATQDEAQDATQNEAKGEAPREAMSIREFAARFEGSILYEELGGFLLPLNPEEARRSLRAAQAELSPARALPKVRFIEPNAVVHAFASGCGVAEDLPSTQETPNGVKRVNRLEGQASGPFNTRVWIVDSGIASDFDGSELEVLRTESVECTPGGCPLGDAANDELGHGTSIAGTVGAKNNAIGLVGIAPGVDLIAVQIFRQSPHITLKTAYRGIKHVADNALSGDVVNISWGADWHPDPQSDERMIEVLLEDMARNGIKIAVSAGNIDTLNNSGYVQTVSPARAGAFRHQASGGAIVTVSAANSQLDETTGTWADVFWPQSGFGNGEIDTSGTFYLGPPDFADPGVDILSLWPGTGLTGERQVNTCTGTSFATAHMSGILATGMPQADGKAAEDPSALKPDGQYDPAQLDRIGVR